MAGLTEEVRNTDGEAMQVTDAFQSMHRVGQPTNEPASPPATCGNSRATTVSRGSQSAALDYSSQSSSEDDEPNADFWSVWAKLWMRGEKRKWPEANVTLRPELLQLEHSIGEKKLALEERRLKLEAARLAFEEKKLDWEIKEWEARKELRTEKRERMQDNAQ